MKHYRKFLLLLWMTSSCISPVLSMFDSSDESSEQEEILDLETKLHKLAATDPDKIFINSLPNHKRESQPPIVQRLVSLSDAITIDTKKDTITLEGPLIEVFVQNTHQDFRVEQLLAKQKKSPAPTPKKQAEKKVRFADEQMQIPVQPPRRTKYDILQEANPAAVTIVNGSKIEAYTKQEKTELLLRLCSVLDAVEERGIWGEHTKEITINVAQLSPLLHNKEKEPILQKRSKQLITRGTVAAGLLCFGLGYWLAHKLEHQ